MRRHKTKIQKIINEIKCALTASDIFQNSVITLKLNLLSDVLNDYFSAIEIIKERGEIVEFNKGTSFGANPMYKIKNDALKQILKISKDIFSNDERTNNAQEFIESLINE